MLPDEQDPFGEYAPESQTNTTSTVGKTSPPDEVESEKYGIGKPRRVIIRGNVATDSGTEDKSK